MSFPKHIQFVWQGINDEANLRQFLVSDFNFPEWNYYGRGTGENSFHYEYSEYYQYQNNGTNKNRRLRRVSAR
jgi:hypothetical protein